MMPLETLPPDESDVTSPEISRRKLLKILTLAGAGASAAVLLSGKWVKPVAAGSKLAPHAQTSIVPTATVPPLTTHHFIPGSGTAQQNPPDDASANLLTSAKITAPDPNIPIVATVSADIPTLTGDAAPNAQTVVGTQTVNTDATGTASFTFSNLPINCQNVPAGSTTITVVFTFKNDPGDGSGNLTATTTWTFGC